MRTSISIASVTCHESKNEECFKPTGVVTTQMDVHEFLKLDTSVLIINATPDLIYLGFKA